MVLAILDFAASGFCALCSETGLLTAGAGEAENPPSSQPQISTDTSNPGGQQFPPPCEQDEWNAFGATVTWKGLRARWSVSPNP